MKNDFITPEFGRCKVELWESGAYGFSLPKKIEISTPGGDRSLYLYRNVAEAPGLMLTGKVIMRIAIGQFLWHPASRRGGTELHSDMPMYDGPLLRAAPPRSAPIVHKPVGRAAGAGRNRNNICYSCTADNEIT